jgi:hypothetical protein
MWYELLKVATEPYMYVDTPTPTPSQTTNSSLTEQVADAGAAAPLPQPAALSGSRPLQVCLITAKHETVNGNCGACQQNFE